MPVARVQSCGSGSKVPANILRIRALRDALHEIALQDLRRRFTELRGRGASERRPSCRMDEAGLPPSCGGHGGSRRCTRSSATCASGRPRGGFAGDARPLLASSTFLSTWTMFCSTAPIIVSWFFNVAPIADCGGFILARNIAHELLRGTSHLVQGDGFYSVAAPFSSSTSVTCLSLRCALPLRLLFVGEAPAGVTHAAVGGAMCPHKRIRSVERQCRLWPRRCCNRG